MSYCPKCGMKVEESQSFCINCGAALTAQPIGQQFAQSQQGFEQPIYQQSANQQPVYQEPDTPKKMPFVSTLLGVFSLLIGIMSLLFGTLSMGDQSAYIKVMCAGIVGIVLGGIGDGLAARVKMINRRANAGIVMCSLAFGLSAIMHVIMLKYSR